jgi:hypothetical protein
MSDGSRGRPSKVARVIDEYDLDGLGDELEAAWTAPASERRSLRDLASEVNARIVRAVLERRGDRPLPGEVETVRAAVAGETDGGTTRDVATRLADLGVELETLDGDFVSHQAVRTYLTAVRDAEYEANSADPADAAGERIQRLAGRLRAVTSDQLASLDDRDVIEVGETRPIVSVQVYCEDCGRQFDVGELLDRGGCDCG